MQTSSKFINKNRLLQPAYAFILFLIPMFFLNGSMLLHAQTGKIGINTQTPTEALDVNGKIRIREGAQQGYVLMADSLGSATWSPVSGSSGTKHQLCISDFGALGDGTTDNTTLIQEAIDSVAKQGGTLCIPPGIYRITGTLSIPAGFRLEGYGTGNTMTGTPSNGSIVKYAGNGYALRILGSGAGLKNIVLYNENNAGAAGAICLEANSTIIESCHLSNILISGFTDGTALQLKASSNGGITYCTFEDIRIRHAKTGIHIVQDNSSFVNSNLFTHGAISGGGFDYCLYVESGNNNVFNGLVMEPYSSVKGHLVVEGGSITGNDIRIEGNAQPTSTPLIEFKPGTYGSTIDGIYGGGLTLDRGNNSISLRSGKSTTPHDPGTNLFQNSGFLGLQQNMLPGWIILGNGITLETLNPELAAAHRVLKLSIPPGVLAELKPAESALPEVMNDPRYDFCNFGFQVKSNVPGSVATTFNAPAGMVTSAFHPGDNTWNFIGMTAIVNRQQIISPSLRINNTNSGSILEVLITAPTFCFGQVNPLTDAKPLTSNGGVIYGTLSTSLMESQASSMLTLEKAGNVFLINGTTTISRINHLVSDRFPRGTVITLLFNQSGCSVSSGLYLILKASFVSTVNASLTLISIGDGTWRELNRNQ